MSLRLIAGAAGRFALIGAGGSLVGLTAGVELAGRSRLAATAWRGGPGAGLAAEPSGELVADLGSGLWLRLAAEAPPMGPGLLLTLTVQNDGPEPVRLQRLLPLIAGEGAAIRLAGGGAAAGRGAAAGDGGATARVGGATAGGEWGVYKQGWQSWSYVGWRPLDGADVHPRSFLTRAAHADPSWPSPKEPGHFQSEGMLMLGRAGGQSVLLAGFAGGARLLGRLEVRRTAAGGGPDVPVTLEAWCEADGIALAPGGSLTAEPLLIALAPEREALDGYSLTTGRLMQARVPDRSPAVWCSWYYHFTKVTEEDVLMAAHGLRELRQSHPVDVIQLDDGYQQAVGDWLEVNRKFPHGLAWLAQQIADAGFRPGLWIAPLIALRRSRLFREHPDWFVKNEAGRPQSCGWNPAWGDIYYALDTTHPAAAAWLEGLIKALVAAGFTYLKLDFLYGAAMKGVRHDPQVTRAAALRRGLAIIRRAAGEEIFLLGCGSPMLPAVGVVDGMRVGPDVAPTWRFKFMGLPILRDEPGVAAMQNAVRVALTRQWMHRRLWLNDPDSLVLRQQESGLTPDEARALASVGGLSAGILSFSDQPGRLESERLDWLRRILPYPGQEGFQPVTLLGDEFPFLSTVAEGDRTLLLAFNGGDEPRGLCIGPEAVPELTGTGACHVYECWEGRYLGIREGAWDAGAVPPHGSRVLALTPTGEGGRKPGLRLVGSTFHLSPGAIGEERSPDGRSLTLHLPPDRVQSGSLTVALPPHLTVESVAIEQGQVDESAPDETGLTLTVTSFGGATIRIRTTVRVTAN